MSDNLNSAFDPKKQALDSQSVEYFARREWSGKKKTCWQCQKDKSTVGGHQKVASNFYKFICKDCCEINAKNKKDKA